jgi:diguanylate cyclase (GGDEF)-like protein
VLALTADRVDNPVMTLPRVHEATRWLARFGPEVPAFAHVLLASVERALVEPERLAELRKGAQSLGVLRAQEGHAVAGLVEDLVALRDLVDDGSSHAQRVIDTALALATEAYVDEITAVLSARATRDPLTGMPNRAAFEEALLHELAATERTSAPALLLVDLDRFKLVNDTDGHLAGDAVLVEVAAVLHANLRPADVACRLGGDEFAVVMPRTTAERAQPVAKRLLLASRRAAGLSSPGARVTLSIGIGWLPQPDDVSSLVAEADRALYQAKADGGDQVRSALESVA